MASKQSIRQPSHDHMQTSAGTVLVGTGPDGAAYVDLSAVGKIDANDSIRLAAFLNRFYAEQNQAAQRTQAQAERRAAAARAVK